MVSNVTIGTEKTGDEYWASDLNLILLTIVPANLFAPHNYPSQETTTTYTTEDRVRFFLELVSNLNDHWAMAFP